MDTNSFIGYMKTDGIYKDVAKKVETRFALQIINQDAILLKGRYQKGKIKK